jgi:erythromycin esterase
LLSAKGLTRNGYLAAKFLAAFAAMLVVFVALPLGSLVGSVMPWTDQNSLVPISVWNSLQPFLTVVVPDVFFVSALFFAVGAVTRKQFVVSTTGFLLLVAGILVHWLDNEQLAILLDPFGGFPLTMMPGSEMEVVPLTGFLLRNRLLWLVIAAGLLAVAFVTVKLEMVPRQRLRARRAVPALVIAVIALIMTMYSYGAAEEKAGRNATQAWLATHAVRLRTVEARNGFDDVQPLKQIVGNARVVALGEATHGTREFFQIKHRMLEFLVTQMGFTVFGIEATMPEAYAINDYVLTGKGDPARALAALYFWTWNTEEVLDMIQWMRQYNADPDHLKKVRFYGFDIQSAPRAVKVTLAYLRKVDPEQAETAEKALAQLANPITDPEYLKTSSDTKAVTMAAIGAVVARFDAHKSGYVGKTSEDEWAVARQHANIVKQNVASRVGRSTSNEVRDKSMAENIRWILDHERPGTKMVVWAHNMHVATQDGRMGAYLRKALASEMVVFGFAFNEGSFQSRESPPMTSLATVGALRPFDVGPAPAGSLDETLAAAGLQIAAIDLRGLPTEGGVAKWFGSFRRTRSIGSMYVEAAAANFLLGQVTPKLYDALLFVERTSAARPNKSGTRAARQKLDRPTNLDFEAGEPGEVPEGWITTSLMNALGFESETTGDRPYSGKRAVMLSRPAGDYYGESDGSVTQGIDATAFRGRRVRLRLMARADGGGLGNQAYVRLQVTNPAGVIFDNLIGQPVNSTDWRSYEVEADVPADADTITYGVYLVGTGRVWMDAVSIEAIAKTGSGGR